MLAGTLMEPNLAAFEAEGIKIYLSRDLLVREQHLKIYLEEQGAARRLEVTGI
ncbi:MAG: hypothetical protein H0Z35_10345 [Thermoanaerobacteraceae bacterium]|nr:hypothetical protein [Thermoanaerobacteraceae bacterium]